MEKMTFTGCFHNTSVNVIVKKDENSDRYLTLNQILRAKRELCGVIDCHCGGFKSQEEPREEFYMDWQLAWVDKKPKSTKIYL